MNYVLESKADWPDPAVAEPDPEEAVSEQDEVEHEWAGDLYESGDESDPVESYAVFTGANGEEAWLDRAPDGTLTAWVRDSDGSVYRYSDADAWATDVDDSGMSPVDTSAYADTEPGEEEAGADGTDPTLEEEPAPEDAPADEAADPLEEEPSDDAPGDDPDAAEEEPTDEVEEAPDGADDEEGDDDDFLARMKRGREGKSYLMTFRDAK